METPETQRSVPPELLNVVKYLRSGGSGLKNRSGVFNGRRVEYFKGKSAIKALLRPAYGKLKNVPKVTSTEEAGRVLAEINSRAFFLRVERNGGKTKILQITAMQGFSDGEYYCWFYQGSQILPLLGGLALILAVFAAVLFPLWPPMLRNGVWYLSVGVLGLFGLLFVIAVIRLILFGVTMFAVPPGLWIFPNLFEDVSVIDSFIPFYDWEKPKAKKKDPSAEATNADNQGSSVSVEKDRRTTVEDADQDETFSGD